MRKIEKKEPEKKTATQVLKEIKRQTRRLFSAEEKIKIVLEGMRGEDSIAGICRRYGIHQNNYFNWSKEFIEAGKRRLSGDTVREATRNEVAELKNMNDILKRELGEIYIENRGLKKILNGLESKEYLQ